MSTQITAQLISVQWIRENLPVAKDISEEDLKPFIFQAQDFQSQSILGSNLYQKLMNDVAAANITGDYLTLAKLIRPAIGYFVLYNALPFLNWKVTAKAVMVGTADTANAAGLGEINYLKGYFKGAAEFYSQRVKDYICLNSSSFPEYSNNTGTVYPDQRNSYGAAGQIYLGNSSAEDLRAYYGKDPNFTS